MAYSELLRSAYVRTSLLGYAAAPVHQGGVSAEHLFAALQGVAEVGNTLAECIAAPGACDLAHRCATLALDAAPRFARAIGCEVVPTLGSVIYEGIPILVADCTDLDALRRRACYHVWWSVGACQVVDITLMAHLALLKEALPPKLLPIVGAADGTPGIAWHPYLVGEAALRVLTRSAAPVPGLQAALPATKAVRPCR